MNPKMIRVLVAEDSVSTREFLVEILRSDPQIQVVGEAKNGLEAVEMTKGLRPSAVVMDISMPLVNGFDATKRIMIEAPTPIVIVSASYEVHEVEVSMHALRCGALAVLPKPPGLGSADFEGEQMRFVETVKAMSQVKVVRHWSEARSAAPLPPKPHHGKSTRARIVAVSVSTGGPAALSRLLSNLPGDLAVPVLVVQHMAAGFVEGLASWLNATSALKVKVAEERERLEPHTVYFAPDHHHLGVSEYGTIQLSSAAPIGGFRPSGTFLFESVARAFGASAVALVLTGMGQDGVEGLRAVHMAGGRVIAQDEKSSVVFGMPGVAIATGYVDDVLPIDDIAFRLTQLV